MTRTSAAQPWAAHGLGDRPPAGVTLHVCDLDSDADLTLAEAVARLSPDEVARAARFVRPRDRERYQRARGFLRGCLAGTLDCAPDAVVLVEGVNGKPRLADPVPPGAPEFNLSHSGGLAVLALSRIGAVGIDIESPERPFDPLDLAATVLCPDEQQAIADLPKHERLERFLVFWMAKEARMKLTGEGMALAPRNISLYLADGMPAKIAAPAFPAADIHLLRLPGRRQICALATLRSQMESRQWA
jgi:4'-phosphopantetheinyl transferase